MRVLSQALSYLFHPIWIPLYSVVYLMGTNPFRYHDLSTNVGGGSSYLSADVHCCIASHHYALYEAYGLN